MSGHNRWSKLKRRKAVEGVAKGKLYTKLIKELTVAARLGGGDSSGNARLRTAMNSAREANMPADIIQRAIKKGTGELEGVNYEEAIYEGYGPGGVAVLIECLTDNTNRTLSDLRMAMARGGGNLGTPGAVAWMFQKKGVIGVKPGLTEDQVMERALEAGADDVLNHGPDGFEVRTDPTQLHQVAQALERQGLLLSEQKWSYLPSTNVRLAGENAEKMLELMDALDDNDDVQNVYANYELDEQIDSALGLD
jgi:YebC/PmpR family DNA-binding regulatory protein